MEPTNITPEAVVHRLFQITFLSKYLALALFIIIPFVAGYIGFQKGIQISEPTVYQTVVSTPSTTIPAPTPAATSSSTPSLSLIDEERKVPVDGIVNIPANGVTITLEYASSVEKNIQVKDGETVLQKITAPTEYRLTDSCTDANGDVATNVKLQDLDFDGDLDIGVLSIEAGGHCAYDFYTYYLFDKDKREFATSTSLEFNGVLTVDQEKKTLTFLARTGMDWNESVYYFKDGSYYLNKQSTLYTASDPVDLKDLTNKGA